MFKHIFKASIAGQLIGGSGNLSVYNLQDLKQHVKDGAKQCFAGAVETIKDADDALHEMLPYGQSIKEEEKKFINEITGARKRNHKRLDEQKQQCINDAMRRINENIANNESDIRKIVTEGSAALKQSIDDANNNCINSEPSSEDNIPNPIFAYDECLNGTTDELTVILNLDPTHEAYRFFMRLNPIETAYLAYVGSDINIAALKMLSEHNHQFLNSFKVKLQTKLWQQINNAIVDADLNKVKRIISAFILFNDEDLFFKEVQDQDSICQVLISHVILKPINTASLMFSETYRNFLDRIPETMHAKIRSTPRCMVSL